MRPRMVRSGPDAPPPGLRAWLRARGWRRLRDGSDLCPDYAHNSSGGNRIGLGAGDSKGSFVRTCMSTLPQHSDRPGEARHRSAGQRAPGEAARHARAPRSEGRAQLGQVDRLMRTAVCRRAEWRDMVTWCGSPGRKRWPAWTTGGSSTRLVAADRRRRLAGSDYVPALRRAPGANGAAVTVRARASSDR